MPSTVSAIRSLPQIDPLHLGVGLDLLRRPLGDDVAPVHHGDPLREPQHDLHVVLDQQDGDIPRDPPNQHPRPRRAVRGKRVISRPWKITRPEVGGIRPQIMLTNVVFPAPLGPMIALISPRSRQKFTKCTARRPPNHFSRLTVSNSGLTGAIAATLPGRHP